jgi:hypothetical protein
MLKNKFIMISIILMLFVIDYSLKSKNEILAFSTLGSSGDTDTVFTRTHQACHYDSCP